MNHTHGQGNFRSTLVKIGKAIDEAMPFHFGWHSEGEFVEIEISVEEEVASPADSERTSS